MRSSSLQQRSRSLVENPISTHQRPPLHGTTAPKTHHLQPITHLASNKSVQLALQSSVPQHNPSRSQCEVNLQTPISIANVPIVSRHVRNSSSGLPQMSRGMCNEGTGAVPTISNTCNLSIDNHVLAAKTDKRRYQQTVDKFVQHYELNPKPPTWGRPKAPGVAAPIRRRYLALLQASQQHQDTSSNEPNASQTNVLSARETHRPPIYV